MPESVILTRAIVPSVFDQNTVVCVVNVLGTNVGVAFGPFVCNQNDSPFVILNHDLSAIDQSLELSWFYQHPVSSPSVTPLFSRRHP